MTSTESSYQFRNNHSQLGPLQAVLDPITRRELAAVGVKPGQRALDVGAGAGSIVAHLAGLVGPHGKVTAVDADTRLLHPTAVIDVYQRDLRREPIPGEPRSIDLATARCVLEHLPNRRDVLRQMIDLLRPGGWLVLGEIVHTPALVHRASSNTDSTLITGVIENILAILAGRAVNLSWGDEEPNVLLAAGLNHVHTRWHSETWTGGGPGCALYADNAIQLRDHLIHHGFTPQQLDRFGELMTDPYTVVRSYQFASTRAQKPQ
ncbi:class I SAM-dependent methyltransferase [Micromonospora carbonacea]|uniref:class I SAM-dependent methyltransferase n=1 Tax=Micromonospora carbonacea TaxID=47853 RepID=UPI0033FCA558